LSPSGIDALVGIQPEGVIAGGPLERGVAGRGEVVDPDEIEDTGAERSRDLDRPVARSRVHDDRLIEEAPGRLQAMRQVGLLIPDDHRQRDPARAPGGGRDRGSPSARMSGHGTSSPWTPASGPEDPPSPTPGPAAGPADRLPTARTPSESAGIRARSDRPVGSYRLEPASLAQRRPGGNRGRDAEPNGGLRRSGLVGHPNQEADRTTGPESRILAVARSAADGRRPRWPSPGRAIASPRRRRGSPTHRVTGGGVAFTYNIKCPVGRIFSQLFSRNPPGGPDPAWFPVVTVEVGNPSGRTRPASGRTPSPASPYTASRSAGAIVEVNEDERHEASLENDRGRLAGLGRIHPST